MSRFSVDSEPFPYWKGDSAAETRRRKGPEDSQSLHSSLKKQKDLLVQIQSGRLKVKDGGAKVKARIAEIDSALAGLRSSAVPDEGRSGLASPRSRDDAFQGRELRALEDQLAMRMLGAPVSRKTESNGLKAKRIQGFSDGSEGVEKTTGGERSVKERNADEGAQVQAGRHITKEQTTACHSNTESATAFSSRGVSPLCVSRQLEEGRGGRAHSAANSPTMEGWMSRQFEMDVQHADSPATGAEADATGRAEGVSDQYMVDGPSEDKGKGNSPMEKKKYDDGGGLSVSYPLLAKAGGGKCWLRHGILEPIGGRLSKEALRATRERMRKQLAEEASVEADRLAILLRISEDVIEEKTVMKKAAAAKDEPVSSARSEVDAFEDATGRRFVFVKGTRLITVEEAGKLLRTQDEYRTEINDELLSRRRPPIHRQLGRSRPPPVPVASANRGSKGQQQPDSPASAAQKLWAKRDEDAHDYSSDDLSTDEDDIDDERDEDSEEDDNDDE